MGLDDSIRAARRTQDIQRLRKKLERYASTHGGQAHADEVADETILEIAPDLLDNNKPPEGVAGAAEKIIANERKRRQRGKAYQDVPLDPHLLHLASRDQGHAAVETCDHAEKLAMKIRCLFSEALSNEPPVGKRLPASVARIIIDIFELDQMGITRPPASGSRPAIKKETQRKIIFRAKKTFLHTVDRLILHHIRTAREVDRRLWREMLNLTRGDTLYELEGLFTDWMTPRP